MSQQSYDVLVIGAGPGGYVTAIRASQLGFKTAIVEREHLGGICLNWGCIPTKALLRSAEIYHYCDPCERLRARCRGQGRLRRRRHRQALAWRVGPAQCRCRLSSEEEQGRRDLGRGHICKAMELLPLRPAKKKAMEPQNPAPKGVLGAGTYKAKHIVVATGARPRVLPGIEPDGKTIWTYFEAMVPPAMPKSLIVMGSGAIGIEFASFYRTLGVEVTVIELLPQILPVEDAEIAGLARKAFEKQGMKIHTGAKVTKVEKTAGGVTAHVDLGDGKTQTHERREADLCGGRRRQCRRAGPRQARRQDGSRHDRHRRVGADRASRGSMRLATWQGRRCSRTRPSTRA